MAETFDTLSQGSSSEPQIQWEPFSQSPNPFSARGTDSLPPPPNTNTVFQAAESPAPSNFGLVPYQSPWQLNYQPQPLWQLTTPSQQPLWQFPSLPWGNVQPGSNWSPAGGNNPFYFAETLPFDRNFAAWRTQSLRDVMMPVGTPVANNRDNQPVDLRALFSRLDRNFDGLLTRQELGMRAFSDGIQFSPAEVLAIRSLWRNFDAIRRLGQPANNPGSAISYVQIQQLADLLDGYRNNSGTMTPDQTVLVREIIGQLEPSASNNLYADQANPLRSIVPEACNQLEGNCHFAAAMASVARTHPEQILQMIRDNGNNTYTVTFPGYRSTPVTVMAAYGGDTSYGIWPQVLQQAYRSMYGYDMLDGRTSEDWRLGSTSNNGLRTMNDDGMRHFLGQSSIEWYQTSMHSLSFLDRQLTDAFAQRRPVTASISFDGLTDFLDGVSPVLGFSNKHSMSVQAYESNPANLGQSMITVRNPQGFANMNPNLPGNALPPGVQDLGRGFVRMPLEIFARDFCSIAVGSPPDQQGTPLDWLVNHRLAAELTSTGLSVAGIAAGRLLANRAPVLGAGLALAGSLGLGTTRYSINGNWESGLALGTAGALVSPIVSGNSLFRYPGAASLMAGSVGVTNLVADWTRYRDSTYRTDLQQRYGYACLADLATIGGAALYAFPYTRRAGAVVTMGGLLARAIV
jgi:hypothetical protein